MRWRVASKNANEYATNFCLYVPRKARISGYPTRTDSIRFSFPKLEKDPSTLATFSFFFRCRVCANDARKTTSLRNSQRCVAPVLLCKEAWPIPVGVLVRIPRISLRSMILAVRHFRPSQINCCADMHSSNQHSFEISFMRKR